MRHQARQRAAVAFIGMNFCDYTAQDRADMLALVSAIPLGKDWQRPLCAFWLERAEARAGGTGGAS